MTLLLDMTPTAINRTAIFHIALDTARSWRASVEGWRYGETFREAPIEDRGRLSELQPSIMQLLLGDKGLLAECERPLERRRRRAKDGRMLFFDPLYVLIDEVRAEDIVLVLDLSPLTNPEWHNPRVCKLYEAAYLRLLASGARIGAISAHTATALWANFGLDPTTTSIIPLYLRGGVGGVGSRKRAGENAKPEKRFLCVGSLETRKNFLGLFLAFERSGLAAEGFTLSVVGGDGHGAEEIRGVAESIRGVQLHGFVSDAELRALYGTAWAFAYPSFLEGFGVPILEAMSWGLPVLTSTTGAPPEVAGPHAITVDPHDIDAISTGLRDLARLEPDARGAVGGINRQRAAIYTFDRYIAAMQDLAFGRETPRRVA